MAELEKKRDRSKVIQFLTVEVGQKSYGLPISMVQDINRIQAITLVPKQKTYVEGIINLRGQIIPVIDVRARFKEERKPYTDRTCIIVVAVEDHKVGMIVDEVDEVIGVYPDEIAPQPHGERKSRFINGLVRSEKGLISIMDIEQVLFEA